MSDAALNENVASAIEAIGSSAFPKALNRMVDAVVPFDFMVIFAYQGNQVPQDLFDSFPDKRRKKIHIADYQEGPYLLDPFYLASVKPVSPGFYRLRDLAPDRFYQSEYYRGYYEQTHLAEEVGFFVSLPGAVSIVVSLMRKGTVFSAREGRLLARLFPIVEAACAKNWQDTRPLFNASGQPRMGKAKRDDISHVFRQFGGDTLTPREKEVVEYTLKGHSADATGKILGIAPGTVRIHRRNIYAKLRIHSQGELFSLFIARLSR